MKIKLFLSSLIFLIFNLNVNAEKLRLLADLPETKIYINHELVGEGQYIADVQPGNYFITAKVGDEVIFSSMIDVDPGKVKTVFLENRSKIVGMDHLSLKSYLKSDNYSIGLIFGGVDGFVFTKKLKNQGIIQSVFWQGSETQMLGFRYLHRFRFRPYELPLMKTGVAVFYTGAGFQSGQFVKDYDLRVSEIVLGVEYGPEKALIKTSLELAFVNFVEKYKKYNGDYLWSYNGQEYTRMSLKIGWHLDF